METVRDLPLDSVVPNPDQPRKRFDRAALDELAASIKENGLLQPIHVKPLPDGRYMVVAGERRWRAHKVAGLTTIRALVIAVDDAQRDILAIIENLQRVGITPLEEARAFQRMLDRGYSVEELAQRLGLQQPWRITERTQLLRLRPEYLDLFEKGHLSPSQAFEISRLAPAMQSVLFSMVNDGKCESYAKLRAAADGLLAADSQGALFALPTPTREEQELLTAFEKRIEAVVRPGRARLPRERSRRAAEDQPAPRRHRRRAARARPQAPGPDRARSAESRCSGQPARRLTPPPSGTGAQAPVPL